MGDFILPQSAGAPVTVPSQPQTKPAPQPVVTPPEPATHPFERPPGLDPNEAPNPKAFGSMTLRF